MVAAANNADLGLVRREVKNVLDQCAAWRDLSPDDRRAFAQNMVKVSEFLALDPGWLDAETPPQAQAQGLAEALGPVDDLKQRLAAKPGQVGKEFEAGAMKQGVAEFANLVRTVNFPEFVSGLIQGVFQAIVDASIQQMQAYGELLAATAKSVEQFASDHISDDQAREQVASRYPSLVKVERNPEGGTKLSPASEDADLATLQQMARSKDSVRLDDPDSERKFITAAKLEMARQRQKLMALMVMLGINRIVVTNGKINAKVIFDIQASDTAKRKAAAGLDDKEESDTQVGAVAIAPWGGGGFASRHKHVTTVQSSIDDTSESKAKMKAQLSGEVNVNFRSETLPPERMLDALQLEGVGYLAAATPPAQNAAAKQPAAGGSK